MVHLYRSYPNFPRETIPFRPVAGFPIHLVYLHGNARRTGRHAKGCKCGYCRSVANLPSFAEQDSHPRLLLREQPANSIPTPGALCSRQRRRRRHLHPACPPPPPRNLSSWSITSVCRIARHNRPPPWFGSTCFDGTRVFSSRPFFSPTLSASALQNGWEAGGGGK